MVQHQPKRARLNKSAQGFTIIELLIVIIVIAILSALALPSFLNQSNKAKQSEAKTYIGSMNRAQQAEHVERGAFTTDLDQLGLGISPETSSYIYRITNSSVANTVVNRAIPSDGTFSNTPDAQATHSAYISGLKIGNISGAGGDAAIFSVVCEAIGAPLVSGELGDTSEPLNLSAAATGAPTCDTSKYKRLF